MSGELPNKGQEPTDPPAGDPNDGQPDPNAQEQQQQEQQQAGSQEPEEGDVDSLPQWARDAITRANNEAAERRVKLNELNDKLKDAKTPEEVQELIPDNEDKVTKATLAAERERAGRRHKLPDELVALLQGNTAEELDAHAKTLSALVAPSGPKPPEPLNPAGGRDPRPPAPVDPRKLVELARRQRG